MLLHCNCVTKKGLLRFVVKCEQMLQGLTASGEEGDDFCCGDEKCARQAGLIGAGLMTASSAAQWLHTWPTPSDAQLMELSVLPGYSVATISHVHCPTRFDKCANQFTLIVFLFAAAFISTLAHSVDGVLAFFFFFLNLLWGWIEVVFVFLKNRTGVDWCCVAGNHQIWVSLIQGCQSWFVLGPDFRWSYDKTSAHSRSYTSTRCFTEKVRFIYFFILSLTWIHKLRRSVSEACWLANRHPAIEAISDPSIKRSASSGLSPSTSSCVHPPLVQMDAYHP